MAKKTFTDAERHRLLRKFHTLIGITHADKAAILESYGVTSSTELSVYELIEICDRLHSLANPQARQLNTWRRRLIGAIAAYLKASGRQPDIKSITAIACRAARTSHINLIPLDRLRSLYNAFRHRTADLHSITPPISLPSSDSSLPN